MIPYREFKSISDLAFFYDFITMILIWIGLVAFAKLFWILVNKEVDWEIDFKQQLRRLKK